MPVKQVFLFLLLLLNACNSLPSRLQNTENLANTNGFKQKTYSTEYFSIASYQRLSSASDVISVFIEGDGLAWRNKHRISNNPTPENPLALKLAVNDGADNIIYLARPCQFVALENEPYCTAEYWTSKRASSEIIESFSSVLDQIKLDYPVNKIRLIGYSGGATIAALLAAKRNDILDLRTVAGNLDIETFTSLHQVSPMTGSLNPVDYSNRLSGIPQKHYYSSDDEVVTVDILQSYAGHLRQHDAKLSCMDIEEVANTTHQDGWEDQWPSLSADVLRCR
mgnify:CR=1 FL=1